MGIVNLKENKDEGRYAVEIVKDLERAKAAKNKLKTDIDTLKNNIKDKADLLPAAEQKLLDKSAEYNQEIFILQDRATIIEQLKIDLGNQQGLLSSKTTQLNIKQQEKNNIENDLNQPGLTPEQIAALQAQLALVNDQISTLNSDIAQINQDISAINEQIGNLEDPKKQLQKVNELTKAFLEAGKERDAIKNEITYLEIIKANKEKRLNDYDAIIADVDARDVWCIDYEVSLEPTQNAETPLVSIEINDDPTHILLAARTYTPTQEDLDDNIAAANNKQEEYNALDAESIKAAADLEIAKDKVNTKRLEINDERAYITTLDPQLSKAERDRLIIESNERLKALETEFLNLVGEAMTLTAEFDSLETKKELVAKVIAEINNESQKIVAALNSPAGIYTPVIDDYTKQLQPTQSSGPYAVFYNQSLLPGFQKWLPTFRTGTIKSINGDFCDVTLDDAVSSQQKLNINQQADLVNVPIKYGYCNAAVFVVGDNVVVEFKGRDQTKPAVVGFQDHPRACGGLVCIPASNDAPNGWGYPLKDAEGIEINPPLGTPNGTRPQYIFSFTAPPVSTARLNRNIETAIGGNCHSNGSPFVSWHGPFGFNVAPDIKFQNADLPGYQTQVINIGVDVSVFSRFTPNIYQNKKVRAIAPGDVLGAGLFGNVLVCVVSFNRLRDDIYYYTQTEQWSLVGSVNFTDGANGTILPRYHCYWFSDDGSKITSLITSVDANISVSLYSEYANIPLIELNKTIDGIIELVSISTPVIFNNIELTSTTTVSLSGTVSPSPPVDYSYTSNLLDTVTGNNEMILAVGFFGNVQKKILAKLTRLYQNTGSVSYHDHTDVYVDIDNTSSGSSDMSMTVDYYLENDLICSAQSTETGLSASAFKQDNTGVLSLMFESETHTSFENITIDYFCIDKNFFLYTKYAYSNDLTQQNEAYPGGSNSVFSRLKSTNIYSTQNLSPINLFNDPVSGSEHNNNPIQGDYGVVESATSDYYGRTYVVSPDLAKLLMTGAVDQHKNGVFQIKAEPSFYIENEIFLTLLPNAHTINSLTGATGNNQRLADMDNIFQPDTVFTDGIIFRI